MNIYHIIDEAYLFAQNGVSDQGKAQKSLVANIKTIVPRLQP